MHLNPESDFPSVAILENGHVVLPGALKNKAKTQRNVSCASVRALEELGVLVIGGARGRALGAPLLKGSADRGP